MQEVTVRKDDLIQTLTKNAETHQADFEIAWEAFRVKAEENLKNMLANLKQAPKGGPVNLHVNLQPPVNHIADYHTALSMCEWEQRDEVTLSQHEFQELVQDDWGWKQQFTTSNMQYTGSASPSTARRR